MLYIVPTPVGNLGDMAPRAIEILRQCRVIYAEDTRTSSVVMRHFDITTPLHSFHKFNEHSALATVMDRLEGGEDIALVSDAGTPGISDPGFLLSRECRQRGIPVVTLPGPTAFVPALVSSGLPCERFAFEGFLPTKKGRATRIAEIAASPVTTIIYESPLRLVKTLEQLAEACGPDRAASVSREISKMHEETIRGELSELISHFTENNPRGEIVIVIGAAKGTSEPKVHRNKYRDESGTEV
ncbi:MAG: 16S rRNA (cytidine(1402)-2'-O)-methyltransferase [Pseudoflavonifractor sp.]|nr:16S rRNA (cytidine(1402)-2'-O)-methyltransferase [Alloprevotella sp.]MCM1117043.1 16S rRNA (cytidine(1402)-2'-O)-methyltransferase [Pseudoflavonifractor sp.]